MEAVLGHAALLLQGRSGQGGVPRPAGCHDPWLHATQCCSAHITLQETCSAWHPPKHGWTGLQAACN